MLQPSSSSRLQVRALFAPSRHVAQPAASPYFGRSCSFGEPQPAAASDPDHSRPDGGGDGWYAPRESLYAFCPLVATQPCMDPCGRPLVMGTAVRYTPRTRAVLANGCAVWDRKVHLRQLQQQRLPGGLVRDHDDDLMPGGRDGGGGALYFQSASGTNVPVRLHLDEESNPSEPEHCAELCG
jgi:hypothetical protein